MITLDLYVICQVCGERVGKVDCNLAYPINGSMFSSPDPDHGYPPPFEPGTDWESMLCSYGRIHRAMLKDNEILTDKGLLIIPEDGSAPYLTEVPEDLDRDKICDRSFSLSEEKALRLSRKDLGMMEEEKKEVKKARRSKRKGNS